MRHIVAIVLCGVFIFAFNLWVRLVQIGNYVRFSHVYKKIIFQGNRANSLSKDPIPNLQILDHIAIREWIKPDLELTPSMFLSVFFLACRDYEIVYYLFIVHN